MLFAAPLLIVALASPSPAATPHPPVPSHTPGRTAVASAPSSTLVEKAPKLRSEELFSLRARRRFAAYIRMRLLELREDGLQKAADAIQRGLPVDQLLPPLR